MDLWITARAAGLALLCMLSISAALGLIASLKAASPQRRAILQYAHRSAAMLSMALLVVHVVAIVLDTYAGVGVLGALVPLASGYRPFAVALGVLSAYAMLITVALGLARSKFAASPRRARSWRALHIASSGLWVMAVIHSLLAGTDTGAGGWARLIVYGCIALLVTAAAVRAAAARRITTAHRQARQSGSTALGATSIGSTPSTHHLTGASR
jgi:sulfoxide reductase heme-binding subunit YedZ